MAFQLVYTSAPTLMQSGRTGFGTVAAHAEIRPSLREQIERLSTFSRIEGLDPDRVLYYSRALHASGETYFVISRISDCGADYTGRTNHIAHHVVVPATEIPTGTGPTPCDVILELEETGRWFGHWEEGPRTFGEAEVIDVSAIPPRLSLPAVHWQQAFGDAAMAAVLAPDTRIGTRWIVVPPDLRPRFTCLMGEAALLHPDPWSVTFATDLQPTDAPAEILWRGLSLNSPLQSQAAKSHLPTIDLSNPTSLLPHPDFKTRAATGADEPKPTHGHAPQVFAQRHPTGTTGHQPPGASTMQAATPPSLRERQHAGTKAAPKKVKIPVPVLAAIAAALLMVPLTGWFGYSVISSRIEKAKIIQELLAQNENQDIPKKSLEQLSKQELRSLQDILSEPNPDLSGRYKQITQWLGENRGRQPFVLLDWMENRRKDLEARVDEEKKQNIQKLLERGDIEKAASLYSELKPKITEDAQGTQYLNESKTSPDATNDWVEALMKDWETLTNLVKEDCNRENSESLANVIAPIVLNNIHDKIPEATRQKLDLQLEEILEWILDGLQPEFDDEGKPKSESLRPSKKLVKKPDLLPKYSGLLEAREEVIEWIKGKRKEPSDKTKIKNFLETGRIGEIERGKLFNWRTISIQQSEPTVTVSPHPQQERKDPVVKLESEEKMKEYIRAHAVKGKHVFTRFEADDIESWFRDGKDPPKNTEQISGSELDKKINGAKGVFVPSQKQDAYLFSEDLILSWKKDNANYPFKVFTIEFDNNDMYPVYDPENKTLDIPPLLMQRLSLFEDRQWSIGEDSTDKSNPKGERIQNSTIDLEKKHKDWNALNEQGKKSEEQINKDIAELKAKWEQSCKVWLKFINQLIQPNGNLSNYSLPPEPVDSLKSEDFLLVIISKLDAEFNSLKADRKDQGSQDREKRKRELNNLLNGLKNPLLAQDLKGERLAKNVTEAIKILIPPKVVSDEKSNTHASPDPTVAGETARFFLIHTPNKLKEINKKREDLARLRSVIQKEQVYLNNPIANLRITLRHEGQPVLQYRFGKPPENP
jgi:hypothetical protein